MVPAGLGDGACEAEQVFFSLTAFWGWNQSVQKTTAPAPSLNVIRPPLWAAPADRGQLAS